MGDYHAAVIRYDAEVDAEAHKQIRGGKPPWQAMQKAVEIVGERRKRRQMADNSGVIGDDDE